MKTINFIEESSIGVAWVLALNTVLSHGTDIKDGDVVLKEFLNLTVSITQPNCNFFEDEILKEYGNKEMVNIMEGNFFADVPFNNWGYSYAQRINNFDGIDQYQKTLQKLKENPESKSATIILNKPSSDSQHIPCVNILDFKLRKDTLILNAFFRSQDIAKKMFADAICLSKIAQNMVDQLDIKNKILNIYIMSAHIYEQDIKNAQRIAQNAPNK